jgi:uncharacterized protein YgiM (DUF1202 family)
MRIRLLLLMLGFLTAALPAQAQGEIPATLYQTVNVRGGPDTRFDIVGQVSAGDTVQVIGRADEQSRWLQVTLSGGEEGWIPSYLLIFEADPSGLPVIAAPTGGEAGQSVTVTATGTINVRGGPSITSDIIDQLEAGDQAVALARGNEANDWLYVEGDDVAGWVAYFTVNVNGDPNVLPLRVPDAAAGADLVHPEQLIATRFNTRLHTEPTLSSPTVDVVPFDTEVTPLAKSDDNGWLYVTAGSLTGWAVVDLFTVTPDYVMALPFFDANAAGGGLLPTENAEPADSDEPTATAEATLAA